MRFEKLAQIDINLLISFAVIAQEGSISKAARRLRWSQPTMTRELRKARAMFQDELLLPKRNGLRPTARGQRILQELEDVLPALDRAIRRGRFNPKIEASQFRIAGTDDLCARFLSSFCRRFTGQDFRVQVDFSPWPARPHEMLEVGRLDLLLATSEAQLPCQMESEKLCRDAWICAVSSESSYIERFTLEQYAEAEHLIVSTQGRYDTVMDQQLHEMDISRRSTMRLPYFGSALACLPGTALVLTLPNSMRLSVERDSHLRLVQAPKELPAAEIWMGWHPRLNDDARHKWLRENMRQAAGQKKRPEQADVEF